MDKNSELDCFLYFIWNAWNEEICHRLYPAAIANHLWPKWLTIHEKYSIGAPAVFYSMLDTQLRKELVSAAVTHYN